MGLRWWDVAAPAGEAIAGFGQTAAAKEIAQRNAEKEAQEKALLEQEQRRQAMLDKSLLESRSDEAMKRTFETKKIVDEMAQQKRKREAADQARKEGKIDLANYLDFGVPIPHQAQKIHLQPLPNGGTQAVELDSGKVLWSQGPLPGYKSDAQKAAERTEAVLSVRQKAKQKAIDDTIKRMPTKEDQEHARDFYDKYGVLPKPPGKMSAVLQNEYKSLNALTREAKHIDILLDKFERAIPPEKLGGFFNIFGGTADELIDRMKSFEKGLVYKSGMVSNKDFDSLAAALSRFDVELAGQVARTAGGRGLTQYVVRMIEPHLPDIRNQTISAVKSRLQQNMVGINNANQALAQTMKTQGFDDALNIDRMMDVNLQSLSNYSDAPPSPQGTVIDVDDIQTGGH